MRVHALDAHAEQFRISWGHEGRRTSPGQLPIVGATPITHSSWIIAALAHATALDATLVIRSARSATLIEAEVRTTLRKSSSVDSTIGQVRGPFAWYPEEHGA